MGLASQKTFQWAACGEETTFSTDSKMGQFNSINQSAVFAASQLGMGMQHYQDFATIWTSQAPWRNGPLKGTQNK